MCSKRPGKDKSELAESLWKRVATLCPKPSESVTYLGMRSPKKLELRRMENESGRWSEKQRVEVMEALVEWPWRSKWSMDVKARSWREVAPE